MSDHIIHIEIEIEIGIGFFQTYNSIPIPIVAARPR